MNIDKSVGDAKMSGIVDYHERKVSEGVAIKDYQNFYAEEGEDIKATLKMHLETFNPKVYKQKYHHIDINFAPYDEITFEDQQQLIGQYLSGMGYDGHLQVRYHHEDKDHDHWHVLLPCSNFSGERRNVANDYLQSTRLSRQLEQAFGLTQLGGQGVRQEKLALLNHEKYRFFRALKKWVSKAGDGQHEEIKEMLKEAMTNDQLRYHFKKSGRTGVFRELMARCEAQGFLEPSSKSQVFDLATHARQTAEGLQDYIEKLQKAGVYVRVVSGKEGRMIKYGLKEKGFYIDDTRLGRGFTLQALHEHWLTENPQRNTSQTKPAIRSVVNRALHYAADFTEFKEHLAAGGIEMVEHSNSGGVYGISFKVEETVYKGSALGFSYDKIQKILETQRKNGLIPLRKVRQRTKSGLKKVVDETLYQGRNLTGRDAHQADFERQKRDTKEDRGIGEGPDA